MRRTRDFNWQYLLFIIPAFVAVLGIQYLNRKGLKNHIEDAPTVAVVKKTVKTGTPQSKADANAIIGEAVDSGTSGKGVPVEVVGAKPPMHAVVASSARIIEPAETGVNICQSIEFPGSGSQEQVSAKDWDRVITAFHQVKQDLLSYVEKSRTRLAAQTFDTMENRIKSLRIQKPPSPEEPDLAWRGIGIFVQDGSQLVRVGGGFVGMIKKDPVRARFELARLMAQTWAPCELASAKAGTPWDEMLKCLGVSDSSGCINGNYSEAGWVVSTVVAAAVSPPACKIGALSEPSAETCQKIAPQYVGATETAAARSVASEGTSQ